MEEKNLEKFLAKKKTSYDVGLMFLADFSFLKAMDFFNYSEGQFEMDSGFPSLFSFSTVRAGNLGQISTLTHDCGTMGSLNVLL